MFFKAPSKNETIYHLPGLGGQLKTGLGKGLLQRGYGLKGRETIGAFDRLKFGEQVELIKTDLLDEFWHPEAKLIATSRGAYLFLHAQSQLKPFPGRVLLLSPVLGEARHPVTGMQFASLGSAVLKEAAQAGTFLPPRRIEVHVGADDWQAGPQQLVDFCNRLGIEIHVAPGRGHTLGVDYVSALLDRWLGEA